MPQQLSSMTSKEMWEWIPDNWSGGSVTCYAESQDGVNWVKPNLGLFKSLPIYNYLIMLFLVPK